MRAAIAASTAFVLAAVLVAVVSVAQPAEDPLPSWNDGPAKRSIQWFVVAVTDEGGENFVPSAERIATFDNDGTLWAEQPVYFQLQFALDRVKAVASRHPEWKTTEPFSSLLAGDLAQALAGGEASVTAIVAASHAGMTTAEFAQTAHETV